MDAGSRSDDRVGRRLGALWRRLDAAASAILSVWRRPAVTASVTLVVFAIALSLIHRELSAYQLSDLERALSQLGWGAVGLAVLAALASYLALGFNDRFGLEMLGKRLPQGRTLRASFAAYALAKSLGWSWATAGPARQRLYRRWGLTPQEIGSLSFLTGLAVPVAALAVAGAGLLLGSQDVASHGPVPMPVWLVIGVVLLVPAVGWLLASKRFGGRKADMGGIPVRIPPPRRAAAHLAALLLDRIGAATVLFVLLPDHGGWTFPAFLAVFVLAGMLGALSGAPGGLGVFEAVILTLSPVSQDTPGAAVALLVYRLIYHVVPLAAATAILGADHAAPAARPAARAARRLGAAAFVMAPQILAVLVFIAGLLLLGSVATPSVTRRMLLVDGFDLELVSAGAHLLAGAVGVLLLAAAAGLWQRRQTALRLAAGLLVLAAALVLLKGLDWEEAAGLMLVLSLLTAVRGAFDRPTASRTWFGLSSLPPGWLAAVGGAVLATLWLAGFAYQGVRLQWASLLDLSASHDAARSARAVLAACVTLGVLAARSAWPRLRRTESPKSGPAAIAAAMKGGDRVRPDANLAFLGDKQLHWSASGRSFVMVRARPGRWIAYGAPVGLAVEQAALAARVAAEAEAAGCVLVWYAVPADWLPVLDAQGLVTRRLGASAIVLLDSPAVAEGARLGDSWLTARRWRFEVLAPGAAASVMADVEAASQAWLTAGMRRERSFSLGSFDRAYLERFPLALLRDQAGVVQGFASLWTTPAGRDLAVDLFRWRPQPLESADGAGPVTEADVAGVLVRMLASWARDHGWQRLDLGMTPDPIPAASPSLMARLARAIQDEGGEAHGLAGFEAVKRALDPQWEELHVAAPSEALFATALMDVAILTAGAFSGPKSAP